MRVSSDARRTMQSFDRWIIDVDRSTVPGRLCFCPVAPTDDNEMGVLYHIQFYGEHPPVKDAIIVGYMVEAEGTDLKLWEGQQRPWLDKLRIQMR